MFTFKFVYTDEAECIIYSVNKVTFSNGTENVVVEGDKIFNFTFPIHKTLHLFSTDGNSVVSATDLRYITITQE